MPGEIYLCSYVCPFCKSNTVVTRRENQDSPGATVWVEGACQNASEHAKICGVLTNFGVFGSGITVAEIEEHVKQVVSPVVEYFDEGMPRSRI